MAQWHCLNMGDGVNAQLPLLALAATCREHYEREGRPPGFAVFARHESDGRLHCEAMVFFSPAAASLAHALGAAACTPPARRGLDLLAGDVGALAGLRLPGEG